MGIGPNGSGVTITKLEPGAPRETYQQRQLRARQAHAEKLREHRARQDAFLAEQKVDVPHEDKMLRPEMATKAEPAFTRADLEVHSKRVLVGMAEERGVTVVRADGRTDLEPTKDDYVRALLG